MEYFCENSKYLRDMVIQNLLTLGERWLYLPISFYEYGIHFKILKGIWHTREPLLKISLNYQAPRAHPRQHNYTQGISEYVVDIEVHVFL